MHFLLPDVFSSAAEFLKWFDFDVYLPPKKEIVVYCGMTPYEQELSRSRARLIPRYDIVCSDDGRYEELIRSHNLRLHSSTRNFRMQILRQLVSHPFNVYEEAASNGQFVTDEAMVAKSSKLSVLDAMLRVLIPAKHRVLVFVQFVEVRADEPIQA